mgnify:CR=1 FL=1
MIWISSISQEPDRCPNQTVTSRPLEASDPSLVCRHILRSQCLSIGTSIQVLASTSVSPFKDLYKSA